MKRKLTQKVSLLLAAGFITAGAGLPVLAASADGSVTANIINKTDRQVLLVQQQLTTTKRLSANGNQGHTVSWHVACGLIDQTGCDIKFRYQNADGPGGIFSDYVAVEDCTGGNWCSICPVARAASNNNSGLTLKNGTSC